jgi:hypothetical protein
MNRAAALFPLLAISGIACGLAAFEWHMGEGSNPAGVPHTMSATTPDSPADLMLTAQLRSAAKRSPPSPNLTRI